jgi:hypothetical protein
VDTYALTVPQLTKMMQNLDRWLAEAIALAEERGFDPEVFVTARLAPDQFDLRRQIQAAADNAKFIPARLTGKQPPSHPDEETTLAELRARIQAVVDYLETFEAADFEGVAAAKLHLPFLKGGWVTGQEYLTSFGFPNFYFHVSMAYAILRDNGVKLGKRTYLGKLDIHPPEPEAAAE